MEKTKLDTSPLSFFRFFLAITIIYLHYGVKDYPYIQNYARAGSVIVFFYMLSGFVLFLNYQRKGAIDIRQYFAKRIISIAPLYYVGLVLYLCILIYMNRFSVFGFVVSFFGVQSLIPHYQHYMNPPSWFVSGLLFFYAVFPVLFRRIAKMAPDPKKLLLSSVVLWLLSIITLNFLFNPNFYSGYFSENFGFIESFPLSNFCSFYMGICGAYYITKSKRGNWADKTFLSIVSTALVLILFLITLTIHYVQYVGDFMKIWVPYESGLYAPIVFLLIFNLSTQKNGITKFLSSKIFILAGSISYALYILQAPIYHIYLKFVSSPMGLFGSEDFTLFIFIFILIATAFTALESKTIKRVSKKYISPEVKRKIPQDPTFGKRDQVFGSKAAE